MSTEKLQALNDALRTTFIGGRVMMTAGIAALPQAAQSEIVEAVQSFDAFSPDNDPHGEHDFAAFEAAGERCMWKIDYYDAAMEYGSDDPSDPACTTRVLTIMLANEY
jgi:hypothetical protein